MQLTKYNHATVVLAENGTTLVIDPGAFTPEAADLIRAASGVLITHEHFDHYNPDAISEALESNPDVGVYGPASVGSLLTAHTDRFTAVQAGDTLTVGPFNVRVFGEKHATIHPDLAPVDNVGYLINNAVFHPGDAYLLPGVPVETLLMPTSGPWTSVAAAVDYVRAIAPRQAVQIHELLLSDIGQNAVVSALGPDGLGGVPTSILPVGEMIEI